MSRVAVNGSDPGHSRSPTDMIGICVCDHAERVISTLLACVSIRQEHLRENRLALLRPTWRCNLGYGPVVLQTDCPGLAVHFPARNLDAYNYR